MSLKLSLCIPTAKRPKILGRLLDNVSKQILLPDEIIIIDGARDPSTSAEVNVRKNNFPKGVLKYYGSDLGLTLQRNVGINNSKSEYICMLDDDVLLEPDCFQNMITFLDSPTGKEYAAVSAFITNNYGRKFFKLERILNKLRVYDGELKPGRWLYCGEFLQLSTLAPFDGIFDTEFLPAGAAIFRRSVIKKIRPYSNFKFGGEDKHWTLRISQKYKIGVLGQAKLIHEHVDIGVRKSKFRQGMISERNLAIILIECGKSNPIPRYFAFIFYKAFKNLIDTIISLILLQFNTIPILLGRWVGFIWNLVPPKNTNDNYENKK